MKISLVNGHGPCRVLFLASAFFGNTFKALMVPQVVSFSWAKAISVINLHWNTGNYLQYLYVSCLNGCQTFQQFCTPGFCWDQGVFWSKGESSQRLFLQVSRSLRKKAKHQMIKEKRLLQKLNINPPWCWGMINLQFKGFTNRPAF